MRYIGKCPLCGEGIVDKGKKDITPIMAKQLLNEGKTNKVKDFEIFPTGEIVDGHLVLENGSVSFNPEE